MARLQAARGWDKLSGRDGRCQVSVGKGAGALGGGVGAGIARSDLGLRVNLKAGVVAGFDLDA